MSQKRKAIRPGVLFGGKFLVINYFFHKFRAIPFVSSRVTWGSWCFCCPSPRRGSPHHLVAHVCPLCAIVGTWGRPNAGDLPRCPDRGHRFVAGAPEWLLAPSQAPRCWPSSWAAPVATLVTGHGGGRQGLGQRPDVCFLPALSSGRPPLLRGMKLKSTTLGSHGPSAFVLRFYPVNCSLKTTHILLKLFTY